MGGGYHRQSSSNEVYSARHVKCLFDSLRLEAGILYQLRNVDHVIQLEGLYEGPRHSVLMTDFLGGGEAFRNPFVSRTMNEYAAAGISISPRTANLLVVPI